MISAGEQSRIADGRRPPLHVSIGLTLALVVLIGVVRLWLFKDQVVPLALAVPLLIHVWTRSRRLLWGMAAAFAAILLADVFWVVPEHVATERYEWTVSAVVLANLALMAGIVHAVINLRLHLEDRNETLEQLNAELEASNEELAAKEEEISRQNEELQTQTEELEQQTEELQQQTEELQQQSEELQQANEELLRRERALQMLLETAGWMVSERQESEVMARLCQAAVQVMAGGARAAVIVEPDDSRMRVRGHHGFGPNGPQRSSWDLEQAFGWLVMEQDRTAQLEDASLRPDLVVPHPADGRTFKSVLATPLRVNGRVVGALELFSHEPRPWTKENFHVIEWLAGQAGLLLEAIALQAELEQRRREAEEASLRKTRFLAAVSHDVRTPANAINLMAELISRSARDPAAAGEIPHLAKDLQANARALVELVSDVLDLARFDSGVVDLQEMDFDLWAMVQAEVRQLMPLARYKGIQLNAEPHGRPVWLRADRMKLARILGNLIGNAIKFTERGSVTIRCTRPGDGGVLVQVSDTGVGISPEHRASIFDEFYQLRNPERDRSKGAGLGLAICKRLADALGCGLGVESELGCGSAFRLSIPESRVIAPPRPQTVAPAGIDEPGGPLAGVRILLVEDHDITRRATARLLAAEGGVVAQAATGREALHLLAHENPQVLLLDLMLPDLDGSEVLRHLERHRPASLACVLAVSGDATESRAEQVSQLGADGLIPKPVDVDRLIRVVRATLRSEGNGTLMRSNL